MNKLDYRADIDGLRGIAVLAVIFYHADILFFKGGFVGVDIFFVISGYLLTSIIINELKDSRFSLIAFWKRRIRRIIPASLFVSFMSLVIFYHVYPENEFRDLTFSAISHQFFIANIYFWQDSGYFEKAAEFKPLLHLWSLSLEEQFYLFFPIFLSYLYLRKKDLLSSFAIVLLFSLFISIYLTARSPGAAFYLLPSRVWEFLFGGILAISAVQQLFTKLNLRYRNILSIVGLFFVFYSIINYHKDIAFPSYRAVLPVAGTALIIAVNYDGKTLVSKILSLKPILFVGIISYSFYLWHWPSLVLYKSISFAPHASYELIIPVFFAFVLSVFTYYFIEKPFRIGVLSQNFTLVSIFSGSLCVCLLSVCIVIFNIFSPKFSDMPEPIRSSRQSDCFENFEGNKLNLCTIGDSEIDEGRFLAIGDSHNLSMLPVFEKIAKEYAMQGYFAGVGGCPPFLGVVPSLNREASRKCKLMQDEIETLISSNEIKVIFMTARWTYYTEDAPFGSGGFVPLTNLEGPAVDIETSRRVFENGFRNTVNYFADKGIKVISFSQVPHQHYWPQEALSRSILRDVNPNMLGVSLEEHLVFQSFVNGVMDSIQELNFIKLDNVLCDKQCMLFYEGQPLYFDDDHLSVVGSEFIYPFVKRVLKEIISE